MDSAYTETEQEALASHLNDKYEKALKEEHGDDAVITSTRKLLKDSAPQVALEMLYLALHASRENTRFAAGKYILDKVLPDAKAANDSFAEALLRFSTATPAEDRAA